MHWMMLDGLRIMITNMAPETKEYLYNELSRILIALEDGEIHEVEQSLRVLIEEIAYS